MMDFDAIAAKVTGALSDVVEGVKPDVGDPYLLVKSPAKLFDIARFCRDDAELSFDVLHCISGLDYPGDPKKEDDPGSFAVVYNLASIAKGHILALRVESERKDPFKLPTLVPLWPAADWHERECYDMLGFEFEGHPDPRRILLPDDWVGHPLRKDYEFAKEWHGMPIDAADSPAGGSFRNPAFAGNGDGEGA